jgi:hypothetical protein
LKPPPGWRVAVGADLDRMDLNADVGLVHTGPDVYLVLLFEKTPLGDPAEHVDRLRASLVADLDLVPTGEEPRMPFAGADLPLVVLRSRGQPPFEYIHGIRVLGGETVQVVAWYMAGSRDKARERLPGALAAVEFLEPAERDAVAQGLLALPDPENAAGSTWSLRSGVFRDFAGGVEWRKPRGFWRAMAGGEAAAVNEDATLYLEEPALGLCALLIVDEGADWTEDGYHETVVWNTLASEDPGTDATEPRRLRLGALTALVSEGDLAIEGVTLRYRIATALRGETGAQFLVWGAPEVLARESAAADAAIEGLRLGDLRASWQDGLRFHDLRLGYAVTLPAGWIQSDRTPEPIAPLGSFLMWESRGNFVGVLAICSIQEGQDERWMLDFIEQVIRDPLAAKLTSVEPSEMEGTLAGLTSRRLVWKKAGESLEVDLLVRGRTIYAFLLGGKGSGRFAAERARSGFTLLD